MPLFPLSDLLTGIKSLSVKLTGSIPAGSEVIGTVRSLPSGVVRLRPSAVGSWFSVPTAVRYKNTQDRTYMTWTDKLGSIWIGAYDHNRGLFTEAKLADLGQANDHIIPAIVVRSDERLIVFYSNHNSDSLLRYRISANPEDITAFGAEQILATPSGTVTYAQVWRYNRTIAVFYRIMDTDFWYWACRVSTDDGDTWGVERRVFRHPLQFYLKGAQHPEILQRIVFGVTQHPDAAGTGSTYSLYSVRIGLDTGSVFLNAGDAAIGNIFTGTGLPLDITSLKLQWDARLDPDGGKAWIWDVSFIRGTPALPEHNDGWFWLWFAKIVSQTDHRYMLVRDGYPAVQITPAGGTIATSSQPFPQPSYSAGIAAAKVLEQYGTAWLVRKSSTDWILEEWRTPDGGSTWANKALLTDPAFRPLRPVAVVNAHPSLPIVFFRGAYSNYTQFLTDLYAYMPT